MKKKRNASYLYDYDVHMRSYDIYPEHIHIQLFGIYVGGKWGHFVRPKTSTKRVTMDFSYKIYHSSCLFNRISDEILQIGSLEVKLARPKIGNQSICPLAFLYRGNRVILYDLILALNEWL